MAWTAGAVVLVAYGAPLFTGEDGSSGPEHRAGYVRISTLKVGDCFNAKVHDSTDPFVDPSPCNHPHNGEVTAKVTLPAGPFPGHRELSEQARTACRERVRGKVRQVGDEEFEPRPDLPREQTRAAGKREVTCTLVYIGDSSLTTNLATGQISPKGTDIPLEQGDCIKKWNESTYSQVLVTCTEKHEFQVLAVYEMDDGRYPGRRKLERQAVEDCAELAVKIWGADPPFDLVEPAVVVPLEHDWRWDRRQAVCLVTGKHGPLKRSVVPH